MKGLARTDRWDFCFQRLSSPRVHSELTQSSSPEERLLRMFSLHYEITFEKSEACKQTSAALRKGGGEGRR